MGAPMGNKNAAGPHGGGAKSGFRAATLRDQVTQKYGPHTPELQRAHEEAHEAWNAAYDASLEKHRSDRFGSPRRIHDQAAHEASEAVYKKHLGGR